MAIVDMIVDAPITCTNCTFGYVGEVIFWNEHAWMRYFRMGQEVLVSNLEVSENSSLVYRGYKRSPCPKCAREPDEYVCIYVHKGKIVKVVPNDESLMFYVDDKSIPVVVDGVG